MAAALRGKRGNTQRLFGPRTQDKWAAGQRKVTQDCPVLAGFAAEQGTSQLRRSSVRDGMKRRLLRAGISYSTAHRRIGRLQCLSGPFTCEVASSGALADALMRSSDGARHCPTRRLFERVEPDN